MAETTISNQIFLSRDQTRLQIIEYLKTYLEIENVDLTKSSFLSFIVNVLSTLTSNLLFYETSVYKEFFLTKAQLPDSILNLSSFLGYSSSDASYAQTDLLMRVPLRFTDNYIKFIIPKNFNFYAGNIQFVTYYRTEVTVSNNNSATVVIQEEDRIYNIPVNVDTTANMDFSFLLPVRQYKQTSQEFQVDSDLKAYQFFTIDVPIKGKVQKLTVSVRDPGGTEDKIYLPFDSLYLMSPTDYGYVSRKTAKGRRLFFGNGLIGVQPLPGSTITVLVNETEGLDGNVIAGSVKRGDRIYYIPPSSSQTKIVDYTVNNPSGATGGTDEEDLEETRSNAIISITALSRLVSGLDYQNANYIVPFTAMALNPIAVLKRSDVKTNEIQLYMPLVYNDSLVPTRNEKISVPFGTTFLPRGTVITDAVLMEYLTLFDLTIDYINNTADYHYIMYKVNQPLTLYSSYGSSYAISAGEVNISKSGLAATFQVPYFTTETDYSLANCVMEFLETDETFVMVNDSINKKFTYTFSDYTDILEGDLTLLFTISHISSQIATYSTSVVFRKDLKSIMMSNVKIDGTSVVIFDIPVVESSYYSLVDKQQFESFVLQNMMIGIETYKYRMLTDFTNVKFVNTYGQMQNMKYNKVTKPAVKDTKNDPPSSSDLGDRYIVGETSSIDWIGQKNNIAQVSEITWPDSGLIWTDLGQQFSQTDLRGLVHLGNGIVLAGTNPGGKILRSTDYGLTWTDLGQQFGETIIYYLVHLGNGIVLAGTNPGGKILRSTDYGLTWTDLGQQFGETDVYSFTYLVSGIVLAGTGQNGHILRSTDYGLTWTDLGQQFGETIIFYLTYLGNGIVLAGTNPGGKILRSTDYGLTWTDLGQQFGETILRTFTYLGNGIVLSGTFPNGKILRSIDYGLTWADLGQQFGETGIRSLVYLDNGIVLAGTNSNGKILRSTNYGLTWADLGQQFGETYIISLCYLGNGIVLAGTLTNGKILRSVSLASYSWTFFEPKTDETIFVESYNDKYLFTGQSWILPRFTCPLQIKAEVFKKDTFVGSDTELSANIKNALIQVFRPRFGPNAAIYRSQIVRVIQSIEGVGHCQLTFPTSDIFFNFDIMTDLTQQQLLEYSPEYVYWTISDIQLKIL